MGPSTKEAFKVLNYMVGGSEKEEATEIPNESLADNFESVEFMFQLDAYSDDFSREIHTVYHKSSDIYVNSKTVDPETKKLSILYFDRYHYSCHYPLVHLKGFLNQYKEDV